jgi:hypothetical protein
MLRNPAEVIKIALRQYQSNVYLTNQYSDNNSIYHPNQKDYMKLTTLILVLAGLSTVGKMLSRDAVLGTHSFAFPSHETSPAIASREIVRLSR